MTCLEAIKILISDKLKDKDIEECAEVLLDESPCNVYYYDEHEEDLGNDQYDYKIIELAINFDYDTRHTAGMNFGDHNDPPEIEVDIKFTGATIVYNDEILSYTSKDEEKEVYGLISNNNNFNWHDKAYDEVYENELYQYE